MACIDGSSGFSTRPGISSAGFTTPIMKPFGLLYRKEKIMNKTNIKSIFQRVRKHKGLKLENSFGERWLFTAEKLIDKN